MAWIGTMPGSTDLGPGEAARRKPTDDGWEGYHMVTAEEMAEKADVSSLSQVAFSGSYNDLSDKPSIPTVTPQVNSDWNATSGVEQILNKPELSEVALSGDYNDLINVPTIPSVRREEVYSGTTGADGRYTVLYSTPYSQTPFVQPMINVDSAYRLMVRVVSSDVNGFTVEVAQRNASLLTLLGLDVLTAGVTVQSNVSVMVKVTAR